jgi:glucose-1-phosphate cytidylyltransferase
MTAVQPAGRYGSLNIVEDGIVADFMEKPKGNGAWINGGFFVCEPDVLELIAGDKTVFEQEPLTKLAINQQLVAYKHNGFWECMDTLRDKRNLAVLWDKQQAPWKSWSD